MLNSQQHQNIGPKATKSASLKCSNKKVIITIIYLGLWWDLSGKVLVDSPLRNSVWSYLIWNFSFLFIQKHMVTAVTKRVSGWKLQCRIDFFLRVCRTPRSVFAVGEAHDRKALSHLQTGQQLVLYLPSPHFPVPWRYDQPLLWCVNFTNDAHVLFWTRT